MKLLVLTSNALRHVAVANMVTSSADEALVIVETQPQMHPRTFPALADHFRLREDTEARWFSGHQVVNAQTLSVMYGEMNTPRVRDVVAAWQPDMAIVFGASLIHQELQEVLPDGKTVNLHLGLSPYYRGSGTNFWPFVNDELEYVGSTVMHLDGGIDSGPIIAHVRPQLEPGDTGHAAGCRVIQASAVVLAQMIEHVRHGMKREGRAYRLPGVAQWPASNPRYYRERDVTQEVVTRYHDNLSQGIVTRYLQRPQPRVQLIEWSSEVTVG